MKIDEIHLVDETRLSGQAGSESANFIAQNILPIYKDQFNHVADIDYEYKIFSAEIDNSEYYAVKHNEEFIAYYQVIEKYSRPVLEYMWVNPKYRNQSLTAKFIHFLQRVGKSKQILLGDQLSDSALKLINKLSNSFTVQWFNGTEIKPYDNKNISQQTSELKPTGWMIMLECIVDYTDLPLLFEIKSNVRNFYNSYLNQNVEDCD